MYCGECGTKLEDGVNVCPNCGTVQPYPAGWTPQQEKIKEEQKSLEAEEVMEKEEDSEIPQPESAGTVPQIEEEMIGEVPQMEKSGSNDYYEMLNNNNQDKNYTNNNNDYFDNNRNQSGYYDYEKPPVADNGGFGWGMLGCCIPIVGLILFLVWKDTKPKTAKAAGIGALVSVIISVLFYIIILVGSLGAAVIGL